MPCRPGKLLPAAQRGSDGRRIGERFPATLPGLRELPETTSALSSPESSYFLSGGALRLDAAAYVQSPSDVDLFEDLLYGSSAKRMSRGIEQMRALSRIRK